MDRIPTAPKPVPSEVLKVTPVPVGTEKVETIPQGTPNVESQPVPTAKQEKVPRPVSKKKEKPEASEKLETVPEVSEPKTEMPSDFPEENAITINGKKYEIKPTKLAYFRNKAAATYNALKNIPLTEIFSIKRGVLDETRDGDQIVYDFLVAVLDDKDLVRENYDAFDADQVNRMVEIFGRINHIEDKYESQRKNREAQGSR